MLFILSQGNANVAANCADEHTEEGEEEVEDSDGDIDSDLDAHKDEDKLSDVGKNGVADEEDDENDWEDVPGTENNTDVLHSEELNVKKTQKRSKKKKVYAASKLASHAFLAPLKMKADKLQRDINRLKKIKEKQEKKGCKTVWTASGHVTVTQDKRPRTVDHKGGSRIQHTGKLALCVFMVWTILEFFNAKLCTVFWQSWKGTSADSYFFHMQYIYSSMHNHLNLVL